MRLGKASTERWSYTNHTCSAIVPCTDVLLIRLCGLKK